MCANKKNSPVGKDSPTCNCQKKCGGCFFNSEPAKDLGDHGVEIAQELQIENREQGGPDIKAR